MAGGRDQLQTLVQNLSILSLDGKCRDKQKLNSSLDDLNAINYEYYATAEFNTIASLLKTICWVVSPSEPFLVSKSCKLICRITKKRQLPSIEASEICSWLIKNLTECSDMILEDILEALYTILKTTIYRLPQVYSDLVGKNGILLKFVQDNAALTDQLLKRKIENPHYVELGVLKCILALLQLNESPQLIEKDPAEVEALQQCANIALKYLYNKRKRDQDEINYCDMLICASNILIKIYSTETEVQKDLGQVIGACRCWMLFSLDGCESVVPHKVMPSQQTVAEIPPPPKNKGGKQIKLRKHRNSKPIQHQTNNWRDASENTSQLDTSGNASQITGYTAANASAIQMDHIAITHWPITSESDMSDSESSRMAKLKSAQAKTRLAALNLLSVIIRTSEKHLIFGYWWALLPDDAGVSKGGAGLAVCIQREPSASGRAAAFTALLSLVTASRSYLSQAEMGKRTTTAFTPFSVTLGHTLENLHCLLYSSLTGERSVPVLVVILKCVVACIQATPYKKFEGKLLSGIVENVKHLLSHKDWAVQVAALIIMGCVVSIDPPVPEVLQIFKNNNLTNLNALSPEVENNQSESKIIKNIHKNQPNSETERDVIDYGSDEYSEEECESIAKPAQTLTENASVVVGENLCIPIERIDSMSWLVKNCLQNLGWCFSNSGVMEPSSLALAPIRLESLQVLSAIALKHFESLLAPYINVMNKMLCSALRDTVMYISLHAAKCVSSLGHAMQKLDSSFGSAMMDDCLSFWTCMLRGPLTELLQLESNVPARAVACDCISSIGETTFNKLPENLKVLSATLLLGSSGDEDAVVRAAAVRALAVCIMYRHWREDAGLISDCGESVLRVLNEAAPAVKVKATWALANITDALLLNIDDPEIETVDNDLLMRLFQESIATSKDNDKIKMNAMRAIGNILLLMNEQYLKTSPRFQTMSLASIERLIYCASNGNNMKVRWNACHALGKSLKNKDLHIHLKKWQHKVFGCLCELVDECKNLKVRAHAAVALRAPCKRQLYGKTFSTVWTGVLSAMESAQHVDDFTEYKHKDHLVEQLCITLAHLACLLSAEDLTEIYEPTAFLWEGASYLMRQVAQKTEPQGATCTALLEAAKFVTTQLTTDGELQTECLNMLQNMFVWET